MSTEWVQKLSIEKLETLAKTLKVRINENKTKTVLGRTVSRTDKLRKKIKSYLKNKSKLNEYMKRSYEEDEKWERIVNSSEFQKLLQNKAQGDTVNPPNNNDLINDEESLFYLFIYLLFFPRQNRKKA
jgi:hypothetical protein